MKIRNKLFLLLFIIAQGCSHSKPSSTITYPKKIGYLPATQKPYNVLGQAYHPLSSSRDFVQEGIASWYGEPFHGRKTANGEIYDMFAETAAHKTLPMDTYIRVSNLKNNKQMIMRINDRGPFVKDRVLDLSYTCARELGLDDIGTAPVKIEGLGRQIIDENGEVSYIPIDFMQGIFTVQVGAFMEKANADRLIEGLTGKFENPHYVIYDGPQGRFYRVRIGGYSNIEEAEALRLEIENKGCQGPFVVAE